jgi:hypothetical protein
VVDKRLLIVGVAIVGGAVAGYLLLSRARRVVAQQQPSQPQQAPSPSPSTPQPTPSQSQIPSKKTYETRITISPPPKAYVDVPFSVMGSLLAVVDSSVRGLAGETIEIYVDGQKVLTTTTGGNGVFDIDLVISKPGTHIITARYPGRETAEAVYKPSEASATVEVVSRGGTVV